MLEKIPTTSSREQKVVIPAIEALREPLGIILEQIKPDIETGSYSMVLGIDGSGRVPALVIGGVVKEIYKKNGENVDIKFLTGSRRMSESLQDIKRNEIKEHVIKWNLDQSKRILLVDDTLASGNSIKLICDVLKEVGYKFDVAAVGWTRSNSGRDEEYVREFLGAERLVIGSVGIPEIYHRPDLSGVEKKSQELFANRYEEDDNNVGEARGQGKELSHDLAEKLINEE